MPNQKSPQNSPAPEEETPVDNPTLSQSAENQVTLPVEGQNENIVTPPQQVQADIGATARQVEDLTMGIEDKS